MADAKTATVNRPVWVDLATSDTAAARDFYTKVFGWNVEVSPDPQYGGYGRAQLGGRDVAGIAGKMSPDAPTAWSLYIGTDDSDALAKRIEAAGGSVVMQPFDVPEQGRMGVFQDPSGAFICSWQTTGMGGFAATGAGAFAWAELNARGVDRAVPFYEQVFGWTSRSSDMGEGQPPYIELLRDGQSILGAMEMNQMIPAEVPSYWTVYFGVDDVDATFKTAIEAGGREMVAPMDFPGGRFAVLGDPQGATFGILKMTAPA